VSVSSATTSTANDVETSLIFVDYSSEPTLTITSKNMVRTDTAVMLPVSTLDEFKYVNGDYHTDTATW
jgi:hypothetical protein